MPAISRLSSPNRCAATAVECKAYVASTKAPATSEQAIASMKSSYPSYALLLIVAMPVSARIQ
jgi:hypothetical protein